MDKKKELLFRNLIYNYNRKLSILQEFPKVLDKVLPNRWDMDVKEENITFILYYPEIKITNSYKIEHIIKDLYIYLYINIYTLSIYMQLRRTTLSSKEQSHNYLFSHYSTNKVTERYGKFCYGSDGNFMSMAMNGEFQIKVFKERDINYFELFLYNLETYLSWESLEGTPYRYINKLKESVSNSNALKNPEANFIDVVIQNFVDYLNSETIKFFNFNVVDNNIQIELNNHLRDFIKESLIYNNNYNHIGYYENNVFIPLTMNNTSLANKILVKDFVYFKGKSIDLQIINEKDVTTEESILSSVVQDTFIEIFIVLLNNKLKNDLTKYNYRQIRNNFQETSELEF